MGNIGYRFTTISYIEYIEFSRDNTGTYSDRRGGSFHIEISNNTDATYNEGTWTQVGNDFTNAAATINTVNVGVAARAIRIRNSEEGTCFDEIKVYGIQQEQDENFVMV